MLREQGNPEYAFLFELGGAEHAYYRWGGCGWGWGAGG